MLSLRFVGLAVFVLLGWLSAPVAAQSVLVSVEGSAALPLTAPQSDHFGPGGAVAAAVFVPVLPWAQLGGRLRAGMLADGEAPADPGLLDPGVGTLETAEAVLRLRPFGRQADDRRATGLFLDVSGGGGITGELGRGTFGAGLGWGIPVGSLAVAPVLRYVQVVQGADPISDEDARLAMLGVEVTFLDNPPAVEAEVPEPLPPGDLDDDGVPDDLDQCDEEPEDLDGFQDDDGCPERDNDGDGKPDVADDCPDAAEDVDGFQDDDGCPDPDNDGDGFLDGDDQCPEEAEVINGNKDYDGCPDEGLIEMRNDRIVLEERVLFDFERARVKTRARPILQAIAELYRQHPEWIEIRIEGHADTRGVEEYNQTLSERRARNVRELLVEYGIPAGIVEAVGYGSARPRDLRDEPEAHHRNRRVEFVVVARRKVSAPEETGDGAPAEADAGGGAAEGDVEAPGPTSGPAEPPVAPAAEEAP
jgi:outer membrane protein OmpA-like peptidoglycan-associated protein